MPKVTTLQESFDAGEVSPLFYGRVTAEKYKKAMVRCFNYIPTLQGPIIRRPGTKYITPVKDSTNPPVLIPFNLSVTQAYMLEFGDGYIRFYANNGLVTSPTNYYQISNLLGGNNYQSTRLVLPAYASGTLVAGPAVLELPTPFKVADVPLLRFAQNKNILYLQHPYYPTLKLINVSAYEWDIAFCQFKDGPYLPLNTINTLADAATVTLTPTSAANSFTLSSGPAIVISGAANNGAGLIRITATAHGYANGQAVFIASVAGTTEANNGNINTSTASWTITRVDANRFDLIGSVFVHSYVSGGTVQPAFLSSYVDTGLRGSIGYGQLIALNASDGNRYYGEIVTGGFSSDVAHAFVILYDSKVLPDTTAISFWQLGSWKPRTLKADGVTPVNGDFPSCLTFHQNRLGFAGQAGSPEEINLSMSSMYESFSSSDPATLQVAANHAIQEKLLSRDVNAVRWISSAAQGLLAGTYVSEWVMTPTDNGGALSPINFDAKETSYFGSANLDSVRAGNATLYIQRAQRKLREMNFFFQVGTFRSTDLSELSEHLSLPYITKLAVQKETQPIIWAVRSDGALLSLTYNRDDMTVKAGWAQHVLGGQSDSGGSPPVVTSIAVIPDPTIVFDQLWMVVKRYINGATVYTVECMTNFFNDGTLQEDAFHLDCGLTYDNPLMITDISSASPAVVSSTAHGLSNGNTVKITDIVGLNKTTTDVDGNKSIANLVNELTFVVASAATDSFALHDAAGNAISSTTFSAYISGGKIRKLVTSISGITFLENETVSVWADGGIHPDAVVSNSGVLTLAFPAAKVQIGYSFTSEGQLLRPDAGSAEGSAQGQIRRVNRVGLLLHRIGDLLIGMDFKKLMPLKFIRADVNLADTAPTLFSGMSQDLVESGYDFDGQFCFRQNTPAPGTINSVTSFLEESDV